MISKLLGTLLIFIITLPTVNAQKYAGAFENSADQQLYAIQLKQGENAVLVRIENFVEAGTAPAVKETIGAAYSQQYQRAFAIYENNDGVIVAHAVELVDNQAVEAKQQFGALHEPNYNSYFGVILTTDDRLLGLRVTY